MRQSAKLGVVLCVAALSLSTPLAAAKKQTVCTITVNSADEKEAFRRHLPADKYQFVELVERDRPDWLASACRAGTVCDVLIISGHYDGSSVFFSDGLETSEHLPVDELERVSCSASCPGLLSRLKEVHLFGCNTLKSEPRQVASAEVVRSLVRSGHSQADAERVAALRAIEGDRRARDRFVEFARDADEAAVQTRMMALARTLGWLSPAQEQAELLRMIADRMARGNLGWTEVDLVCTTHQDGGPDPARKLLATGAPRTGDVAHSAVLACLGSAEAHERTLGALTSPRDEDVAIAQVYLRHRPLANVAELRAVTSSIARMTAAVAQVRALETLAKQRLTDPQSLQEIARLFPLARSLEVQRAIAAILIRSDTTMLPRTDLIQSLRRHRLQSPDGNDVIEVLIRLLQSA